MISPEMFRDKQRGFTLIELLIVVAIALILAAGAAPVYSNLQTSSQLNENDSQISQVIRIARERAVAGFNDARHGVYFEHNAGAKDTYTLYQGDSYLTRDSSYDRKTYMDSALSLSTTVAGNEVNFSKGLGLPSATGTIIIAHSSITDQRTIVINDLGLTDKI